SMEKRFRECAQQRGYGARLSRQRVERELAAVGALLARTGGASVEQCLFGHCGAYLLHQRGAKARARPPAGFRCAACTDRRKNRARLSMVRRALRTADEPRQALEVLRVPAKRHSQAGTARKTQEAIT